MGRNPRNENEMEKSRSWNSVRAGCPSWRALRRRTPCTREGLDDASGRYNVGRCLGGAPRVIAFGVRLFVTRGAIPAATGVLKTSSRKIMPLVNPGLCIAPVFAARTALSMNEEVQMRLPCAPQGRPV